MRAKLQADLEADGRGAQRVQQVVSAGHAQPELAERLLFQPGGAIAHAAARPERLERAAWPETVSPGAAASSVNPYVVTRRVMCGTSARTAWSSAQAITAP